MPKGIMLKASDLDRSNHAPPRDLSNMQYIATRTSYSSLGSRSESAASIARLKMSNASSQSLSSFKQLDLHDSLGSLAGMISIGSSTQASRLSLPARLGNMANATWDNPVAAPAQRRNSLDMASEASKHKQILSMVLELDVAKASGDFEVQEDLEDGIPETVEDYDSEEQPFDVAFTIPTFQETTSKQLDSGLRLSSSDLALLKEDDAFMYYSLPAVKKAQREGKRVDFDIELKKPVKRCSIISFETIDIPSLGEAYYDECSSDSVRNNEEDDFFRSSILPKYAEEMKMSESND